MDERAGGRPTAPCGRAWYLCPFPLSRWRFHALYELGAWFSGERWEGRSGFPSFESSFLSVSHPRSRFYSPDRRRNLQSSPWNCLRSVFGPFSGFFFFFFFVLVLLFLCLFLFLALLFFLAVVVGLHK